MPRRLAPWSQGAALAALLAGCPRSRPVELPDYEAPPILPSPEAGVYGHLPAIPEDTVIAGLMVGHRWDEYLAGAAAGLALEAVRGTGGIEPWEVRERAWHAGYPFTIAEVAWFAVPIGSPPPDRLAGWLSGVPGDVDLGLVRARGMAGEVWVGLVASPRPAAFDLGTPPRRAEPGSALAIPANPGHTLVASDPDGTLAEWPLDVQARVDLDAPGEWLFEVRSGERRLALFPVYVGMEPPGDLLLVGAGAGAGSAAGAPPTTGEVEARALAILGEVRRAYGVDPFERDPVRDSAARTLMEAAEGEPAAILTAFGQPPAGSVHLWSCEGKDVPACLDALVWEPGWRAGLLSPENRYVGIASVVRVDRVEIRILSAEE